LSETPRASEPAVKHWRSFGVSEWRHVKDGVIGLFLGSLVPVGLYYVSRQTWGYSTAVVLVLAWSALVFAWHYRRTHSPDVFSATTFGFACVKATAGLVSQNEWLYLAWPSIDNMVYGIAFASSALVGRPLLALYAERLYPITPEVRRSETFLRAFLVVSIAWLVGHSLRAVLRLWLLNHLPLETYLIADTVAGWPINATLVALTAWYPLRQMRRAGYMADPRDLTTMEAVELAVEETAPTTV
jgi:hypothetical protein